MRRSAGARRYDHRQLDLDFGVFELRHVVGRKDAADQKDGDDEIDELPIGESPFPEIDHNNPPTFVSSHPAGRHLLAFTQPVHARRDDPLAGRKSRSDDRFAAGLQPLDPYLAAHDRTVLPADPDARPVAVVEERDGRHGHLRSPPKAGIRWSPSYSYPATGSGRKSAGTPSRSV